MVEQVEITGVSQQALAQLPKWATEKTLDDIKRHLETYAGLSEQGKKALDDLAKASAKADKESLDQAKAAAKKVTDELKKSREQQPLSADTGLAPDKPKAKLQRFGNVLGKVTDDALGDMQQSLMSVTYRMGAFGRPLRTLQENLTKTDETTGRVSRRNVALAGVLGAVIAAGGMLVRMVTEAANTLRAMNEVGLTGIQTSADLYGMMADLGTSTQELTELFTNYSRELGTFGLQGLRSLVSETQEARDSMYGLGLTLSEASVFGAQYLRLQRLSGIFEQQDQAQQRENFQQTMRSVTAFSRILNVSRQEIMRATVEIMEQDQVRARFAAITDMQQRQRMSQLFQETVGMFTAMGPGGRRFADLLGEMMGAMDPVLVEGFYDLIPFAGQAAIELADLARAAAAGTATSAEQTQGFVNLGRALQQNREALATGAFLQDEAARRGLSFLQDFDEMEAKYFREMERKEREQVRGARMSFADWIQSEKQRQAALVDASSRLQSVMQQLRVRFSETLLRVLEALVGPGGEAGFVNKLGGVFEFLERQLMRFGRFLQDFSDETGGLLNAIGQGISWVVEKVLKAIGDSLVTSSSLTARRIGRALGGTTGPEDTYFLDKTVEDHRRARLARARGRPTPGVPSFDEASQAQARAEFITEQRSFFETPKVAQLIADMSPTARQRLEAARQQAAGQENWPEIIGSIMSQAIAEKDEELANRMAVFARDLKEGREEDKANLRRIAELSGVSADSLRALERKLLAE